MRILYCDGCSTKLTDEESAQIGSGAIPLCFNCSGSHKRATPSQTKILRKTGGQPTRKADPAYPSVPRKIDSKLTTVVAVAVCVVVLLTVTALMVNKKTPLRETATESGPVITTLPTPPLETHTASTTTPDVVEKRPDLNDPAQRLKAEELEGERIGEERAERMLEKAKTWHRDNPEDPITYKAMLADVIAVHASKTSGEVALLLKDMPGTVPAEEVVWLSTLDLDKAKQGWGKPSRNLSVDGHPLFIGGRRFDKGFGSHAQSELRIDLKGGSEKFIAYIGVDEEEKFNNGGSVGFIVEGDGKELFKSKVFQLHDPAQHIAVDIKGVKTLRLLITDGGDGMNGDHADWAEARFLVTGAHPEAIAIP